ncbi:MAG: helix-turn-helix domain-containing protein [Bifidobacteriaceae bacterium]|jgi:transcriptional regulator with XRE-family HTH domain|nr:helix-turn-helix domain-containing protein [Bifidobacteriaceae bacterium]
MNPEPGESLEHRADALERDHDSMLESLIELRRRHGLTQAEVAARMGVTQPVVAQFERYDANPTLSTVRRYAMAVAATIETRVHDDFKVGQEANRDPLFV